MLLIYIQTPNEAIVRIFVQQVYDGQMTARHIYYFGLIFKCAFGAQINDTINNRLKLILIKQELT
jgi:hypothetical protein